MNKYPYIGFWKRVCAFVVDAIIASIPAALLCLPFLYKQIEEMSNLTEIDPAMAGIAVLVMLVYAFWLLLTSVCFWLYFSLLESGEKQATYGKRLLRIKVVGKDGNRISFAHATGRFFAKLLSYATFYIGFIMAGLTNRKRALHDYVAQTYVVHQDFQPGDELPDTPSHLIWLWIISVLCGLVLLGFFFLGLVLQMQSTPLKAALVSTRLQMLANEQAPLPRPIQAQEATYSRTANGYRAVFETMEGEEFMLLLPRGSQQVCCQALPGQDCTQTGLPLCR